MLAIRDLVAELTEPGRSFRMDLPELDLGRGEVCVVTGPSGSGKTLLLETLGLLLRPVSGRYTIAAGEGGGVLDIPGIWNGPRARLAQVRGRVFGFVLQSGGLVPFLTTRENIALSQGVTGRPDEGFLDVLVEILGLSAVADARPARLSIGQRQRVAIGRALAHRPALVIADEPTSALDPALRKEVYAILQTLAEETGTAIVMSSHDADAAALPGIRLFRTEASAVEGGAVSTLREARP
ncbi:MAG: ABC transporter ATP-binding protein [Rubricella sp.]